MLELYTHEALVIYRFEKGYTRSHSIKIVVVVVKPTVYLAVDFPQVPS